MDEDQKTPWVKNLFVFVIVAFCLVVATAMGFDQSLTTKVAEIVADGLISLALFTTVSFLASHAIDYSGILTKVGNRMGGRVVAPQPLQPTYDSPSYPPVYTASIDTSPADYANSQEPPRN